MTTQTTDFDIDSAPPAEPMPAPSEAEALAEFEAARLAAIEAGNTEHTVLRKEESYGTQNQRSRSNGEVANVVDVGASIAGGLFAIAKAINRLADAQEKSCDH